MPLVKSPTLKQRKFAKIYVATGSKLKAIRGSYNLGREGGKWSDKNHYSMANNILASPFAQQAVREELDKIGLNEGKIADRLNRIIDKGTEERKLAFATPTLALDAIKEVNKMKGNYAAERKQVETKSARLNIDLNSKDQDGLMAELQNIQKEIHNFQEMVRETDKFKVVKDEVL